MGRSCFNELESAIIVTVRFADVRTALVSVEIRGHSTFGATFFSFLIDSSSHASSGPVL